MPIVTTPEHPDPVLAVLEGARALLTPEGAWCQNSQARTKAGTRLDSPFASGAARYCLLGALNKANGAYLDYSAIGSMAALLELPSNSITVWNDQKGRRRSEALAKLDRAITARQAAQS